MKPYLYTGIFLDSLTSTLNWITRGGGEGLLGYDHWSDSKKNVFNLEGTLDKIIIILYLFRSHSGTIYYWDYKIFINIYIIQNKNYS